MHEIRFAVPGDEPTIQRMIEELADYENALHEVIATPEMLHEWMFDRKVCECLLAEEDGEAIGMALFFHNYSTWLGRGGIYLEDLYVRKECRGRGVGTSLLSRLAQEALSRGCGRLDWACLDWNQPSIDFYLSIGATPLDEWTTYRLEGETLEAMARR